MMVEILNEKGEGRYLPPPPPKLVSPIIVARSGESSMLLLKGGVEEQREFFRTDWGRLAGEDGRPCDLG
jgi:hypothetical protein